MAGHPRDVRAAGVLRDARRALRRPVRRPRHRRPRAGAAQRRRATTGPIVVHVLTQKGRGYPPAEDDDEKHLHDAPVFDPATGPTERRPHGYTAGVHRGDHQGGRGATRGRRHHRGHARPHRAAARSRTASPIASSTSASPSSTPSPSAAGMAMGGLRPVVAIYSTFLTRAFDQVIYDVGLHGLPVVFCLDRAGITGDDGAVAPRRARHGAAHEGAGHDGVRAVVVPGAPGRCSTTRSTSPTARSPSAGPKAAARSVAEHEVGHGLRGPPACAHGDATVCLLGVGKMLGRAPRTPPTALAAEGIAVHRVGPAGRAAARPRACSPTRPRHHLVVTVEDGMRDGGVGSRLADAAGQRPSTPVPRPAVRVLGTPVAFIPHGKPDQILAELGLDAAGIVAEVLRLAPRRRRPLPEQRTRRHVRAMPRGTQPPSGTRAEASVEGVLAGVVVGGVDHLGDLGDVLADGRGRCPRAASWRSPRSPGTRRPS